jgi:hypothetical protein
VENDPACTTDGFGLKFNGPVQVEGTYTAGRARKRGEAQLKEEDWYGSTINPQITSRGVDDVVAECTDTNRKIWSVYIKKSREYDVSTIYSFVAVDLVGKKYTSDGLMAIRSHEQRRVDSYRMAYDAYLRVFEGEITGMCRKDGLNQSDANRYRKKLADWLWDKEVESRNQFEKWTKAARAGITSENLTITTDKGGLVTGIGTVFQLGNLTPVNLTCPQ